MKETGCPDHNDEVIKAPQLCCSNTFFSAVEVRGSDDELQCEWSHFCDVVWTHL